MNLYFVRIGSLGEIHVASALIPFRRGQRVVLRSRRGIEIGQIASACRWQRNPSEFKILRPATDSDDLLLSRLERHKKEAVELCRQRLSESGSAAVLLEVDQLLDGGTLVMHFLGEIDEVAQGIADDIARAYEDVVRTEHLTELLTSGCGDECGSGEGCGSGCGSCAVRGH